MFQPEVKLQFVRRYCPPSAGWMVFVDIDPSEEGRSGTWKRSDARKRRRRMQDSAQRVREGFAKLGIQVGGCRKDWLNAAGAMALCESFPCIATDRDIVALQSERRHVLIAEVEGESSGQPEQKLYKAIGQLVLAVAETPQDEWRSAYVLVVHGHNIAAHLTKASILQRLNISALHLAVKEEADRWLFGDALLPKLLSGELGVPAATEPSEAHA